MRSITNEELLFVAGGASRGEPEVQIVEIVGQRMNPLDRIWYDLFEAGGSANSLALSDWRKLQMAYEEANNSGLTVTVEISPPTWEIPGLKEGPTKYTVPVPPADCYKRK